MVFVPGGSWPSLQQTLFDEGQNALLDLLRDRPSVGRMSAPGNIGYDLRFAMQRTLPDGAREIILATDRPVSYWEIVNQPVSAQYPFTWVQFRMRVRLETLRPRRAITKRKTPGQIGDRPTRKCRA